MLALRYSLVTLAVIAALAISIALLVRAMQNTSSEAGGTASDSPASPAPSAAPAQGTAQNTAQDRAFDPLVLPPAGKIGADLPAGGTGSEAVGARLQLSTEQQEKVRYVLLSHNIMQSPAADFPLQIGGIVPQSVPLAPLPREVADAVPNYRAYSYVISQNRIAIIGNDRREINFLIPI